MGHGGDVSFHEGYVTLKEARKLEQGGSVEKAVRPELSTPLASYVDLHRHAAVRAKVGAAPSVALRLMVAHAIAGSSLWRVRLRDTGEWVGVVTASAGIVVGQHELTTDVLERARANLLSASEAGGNQIKG